MLINCASRNELFPSSANVPNLSIGIRKGAGSFDPERRAALSLARKDSPLLLGANALNRTEAETGPDWSWENTNQLFLMALVSWNFYRKRIDAKGPEPCKKLRSPDSIELLHAHLRAPR